MALQPQWALDATSNSVMSFSRDLIRVATSDNVQPLALAACQNFGSTIPMTKETCDKIQKDVLPTPSKVMVKFIKTYVGFSRHDCVTQLGSSAAGMNFLGLAAALITTTGEHEAARAVAIMLKESVADPTTPLPTTHQLKELLLSLRPRLSRALFAESVLGWSFLTSKITGTWGTSSCPSSEAIGKLIVAFRRLSLVAEATIRKAIVRAVPDCIPWVTAFTKWCLGVPPSVFGQDGTAVIIQPGSVVDIIASENQEFVVTLQHELAHGLESLIATQDNSKPWSGMVTVERYGQYMLGHLGIDPTATLRESRFRTVVRCVSLMTGRFLRECQFHNFPIESSKTSGDYPLKVGLEQLQTSPFRIGGDYSVIKSLSRLFQIELFDVDIYGHGDGNTGQGRQILESQDINGFLRELSRDCECQTCCLPDGIASGDVSEIAQMGNGCLIGSFLDQITCLAADALAISLFDTLANESDLLVRINCATGRRKSDELRQAVRSILFKPRAVTPQNPCSITCSIWALVDWALELAGHDVQVRSTQTPEGFWAMSCFRGQAIFPAILEHGRIIKDRYLSLSLVPGVLEFEGDRYHIVRGRNERQPPDTIPIGDEALLAGDVDRPLNFLPETRDVGWAVEAGDDVLTVGVCIGSSVPLPVAFFRDPFAALVSLSQSLVVDRCPHDRATPLSEPDASCTYTSPIQPKSEGTDAISVVASDGAEHLRFYSLAGISSFIQSPACGPVAVVRGMDTCLECCISVCREVACKLLIL